MIKNVSLVLLSIALATSIHFNMKQDQLININHFELYKASNDIENLAYQLNMCKVLYGK